MSNTSFLEKKIVAIPYAKELVYIILSKQQRYNKMESQMKMNQLQIYQLLIHRVNPLAHLTINYVAICAYKDNT
ncbi:MAG TPA: hypothetical protein VIS28_05285 [Nitrososphaeraceae archaeon]